jgi:hypothetical protein
MRKLCSVLLLFIAVNLLSAQQATDTIRKFDFGIHSGINISNFTEDADFENRVGLNTGFYATYHIPESNFALRSGLTYSQQGVKTSGRTPSPLSEGFREYEAIAKLDYLQVPVFLQYNFSDNYGIYLGPQISFLVNNKFEYDYNEEVFDSQVFRYEDKLENVHNTSLSAVLGARVFVYKSLFVQAQYELGLYSIFNDDEVPQDSNRIFSFKDFRHSVFTFTLGYQL